MTESEFAVHWEASVYGTHGVYAEDKEEAIEKARKHIVPSIEADDHTGSIDIQFVEEY